MIVKASAPGKLILSGEHSVVFGKPEIISAINRRLQVSIKEGKKKGGGLTFFSQESTDLLNFAVKKTLSILGRQPKKNLKIQVDSNIPVGSGLGSSAALAVATTTALFKYFNQPFDKEKINEIAYEIEKKQHGTPSGGDNTISTYGGFLWYRKETELLKLFQPLKFNLSKLPEFVLINTGRPAETTGEMVTRVRRLYERKKARIEKILNQMEKTTKEMLIALYQMDKKKLTVAIRKNERLLESLGVVSPFAQALIREINRLGGAAKVCGAGGKKKGSGIILVFHPQKKALFKLAKKRNLPAFEVKLGEEGVRYERDG